MSKPRAIQDYCERNGYFLKYIYADDAKTGTNDNREEFLKMIADSKKHLFDVVIIHKLDRFSRNRYDDAIYKAELKKTMLEFFR